jgi:hypothetical protein
LFDGHFVCDRLRAGRWALPTFATGSQLISSFTNAFIIPQPVSALTTSMSLAHGAAERGYATIVWIFAKFFITRIRYYLKIPNKRNDLYYNQITNHNRNYIQIK